MHWFGEVFFRVRLVAAMVEFGLVLAWGMLLRQKSLLILLAGIVVIGIGVGSTYLVETRAAQAQAISTLSPARKAALASGYTTKNIALLSPDATAVSAGFSALQERLPENYLVLENSETMAEVLRRADERDQLAARRRRLDPLVGCTFIQQTDTRLKIVCTR